jgi:uridine nucleosidase
LKAIGREDVSVYPGAAKPFCREPVYGKSIHGKLLKILHFAQISE